MDKEKEMVLVPAIESFGKIYNQERKDWEKFMLHIQTTCEQLMRGKVQTSVTSRVKSWHSLRKKLTKWHDTKQYSGTDDIVKGLDENRDKVDIIGVRIRAFFPKQLKTVYEIIEEFFKVDDIKPFDSDYKNKDELPAVSEKFGNYEGIHYWVRFRSDDNADSSLDPKLWERFKNHAFEIQVRSSMLLDGWAEVRHDITYKALGGLPDRSERDLLDTMKGVVKSMEILLDHLLDVHEDRIKSDETKFESMELFEQALVRALPQLSQAHEGIEDVQILRHFLNALSIDTSGEFKRVMRRTKFARNFEGFQKARVASKAPVWAFIISEIFMTLSRENIDVLITKIPKSNDPNQILCLSIWHLQQYLFSPQQDNRSNTAEIERCTLFWNLHEYICATWPKRDSEILTLIGNLLVMIIASPVPRVDMALFVAFAETLYWTKLDDIFGTPPVIQGYQLLPSQHKEFRWHRHNEFFGQVNIASQFKSSSWGGTGVELLEIDADRSDQFRGAILHRAVCHPNEEEKSIMMHELLGDRLNTNIHFTNGESQSTLLVATIFSSGISNIELLLKAGADINKGDKFQVTPLIIASVLRKNDLREFLLAHPETDVNLAGRLTSRNVREMGLRYADLSEPLDLTKAKFCTSDSSRPPCKNLGCPHCTNVDGSLAIWYTRGHEWHELEEIVKHPTFAILKSFRTWKEFLDCIKTPTLTDGLRTILLEKAIVTINEPDAIGYRLLGAVLRHVELSSNEKLVQCLLDAHADATLPEPGLHMLVSLENIETFMLVSRSLSARQLTATDNRGRTLLHLIARGRLPNDINDANHQVKFSTILKLAGVDKLRRDLQGRTWVHHAMGARNLRFPASFIENCLSDSPGGIKQQLKAPDNDGWTPLHWICYASPAPNQLYDRSENFIELIRLLLQSNANPDQACSHGWTPRLILILLKDRGLAECRQLLPPLVRDLPAEEGKLPGAVISAFHDDSHTRRGLACIDCNNGFSDWRESRWMRYACTTCRPYTESFCFKCGWTKEKAHPGHTYKKVSSDLQNRCFDALQEGIRYALEQESTVADDDARSPSPSSFKKATSI